MARSILRQEKSCRVLLFSDMLIYDTELEGQPAAVNVQRVKGIEMKQNVMSKA
jgi:hypothetical protein